MRASTQENEFLSQPETPKEAPGVLQIIPHLGAGGAEQGCIDVANALVADGFRSYIASHGGHRTEEVQHTKTTLFHLPVHSKNPATMWANVWRLKSIIRQHNINLVHVRSRAPAWSAYKACKDLGVPLVTTFHAPYKITGNLKKRYNSVMAKGDHVIAISEYVADYIREHYEVPDLSLSVIPRGIDMDYYKPENAMPQRMMAQAEAWRLTEGETIVLLPARLTRWKGHHVFIDALSRMNRPDVVGVIVGDDQGRTDYREELDYLIRLKNMEGRIRIHSHCADLRAAYRLAALVVAPSIEPEGFGRVPVEAQAMARPIIATDHGGFRETVRDRETGWLIPPNNAEALYLAMAEALAMPQEQRDYIGQAGRAHVENRFSKQAMTQAVLDVYRMQLQGGAQQNPFQDSFRMEAAQ